MKFGTNYLWIIAPVTLAMATSGCASKKYVQSQVGGVSQQVSRLESKTNQQIAAMRAKERTDVSRLEERITTTNNKVAQVAGVAQEAHTTASQASQMAQANQTAIQNNTQDIAALSTIAQNAFNFQIIEKGDITFGFNKASLDKDAKVALDLIAERARSMPRAVVEIDGFTDKTGPTEYNLNLSRRRADAVARYLVQQDVPLRSINTIGLGEEDPPPNLVADVKLIEPNASRSDIQRLARRVYIRVYAPLTSIAGEAARSAP
jgi:outer membrane protein OmpA-like peptidoglycan-associated protein